MIHNPGIIPSSRDDFVGQDLTVVFQGTYNNYTADKRIQTSLKSLPGKGWQRGGREGYGYMILGTPSNLTETQLKSFIQSVSPGAQYLFITDLQPDQLGGFGSDWLVFTQAMSEM